MSNQISLSWGGFTICNTTDGYSSYIQSSRSPKKPNYYEYFYPNSTGRYKRLLGNSQTSGTSESYSFTGVSYAADLSTFVNLSDSISSKNISVSPHGTLSFGHLDDQTQIEMSNMDCEFSEGKYWRDATGKYFLNWSVKFTKWSN